MKDLLDAALEATVVGGFSRIGYEVRSRMQHWDTDYDLRGQRILITGGTSGLGLAGARMAVRSGATVVITGRDAQRTAAAAERIGALPLAADASDLSRMPDAFSKAVDMLGGLDVLVNNAGALDEEYGVSPQGFEMTYAVHVLAPFLLTAHALPIAKRIITVSSGGMYSQSLDPETMQMTAEDYDGVTAYARAKRVQVALNGEWARRYPEGPIFSAMHPGWADTPGVQHSLPRFRRLTAPILRTPEQGVDTVLWLASHDVPSGLFWLDRTPRSTMRVPWLRHDQATAERVWSIVADQCGVADLVTTV
jgi:NAD(P)-dependent dehydrogenase (short-subunit alcohol dehydrogenase family)